MCQGVSGSWNALSAGGGEEQTEPVGSVLIQQLPSPGEGVESLVCDSRQGTVIGMLLLYQEPFTCSSPDSREVSHRHWKG